MSTDPICTHSERMTKATKTEIKKEGILT